MAFDAFCYCEKGYAGNTRVFVGETQDEEMKGVGAFEIINFELGAENTINIGSISGGGGAGKATFKEFTVTKKTDTASAELFRALVKGTHFGSVVVALRRSGESGTGKMNDQIFMTFTMRMVMVQDISWSGSDGDDVCEETVIFQYGAIRIEYWPQKRDGNRDQEKKAQVMWSRVNNSASDEVS